MSLIATAQSNAASLIGTYARYATQLTLAEDSTFLLRYPNPDFHKTPFKDRDSLSEILELPGTWTTQAADVILNPDKPARAPRISLKEKKLDHRGYLLVKIIYLKEVYENEQLLRYEDTEPDMFSLSFHKTGIWYHLRKELFRLRHYSPFSDIKNQVIRDAEGYYMIEKAPQRIRQLRLHLYGIEGTIQQQGLRSFIEIPVENPQTNYFELHIIHPQDQTWMPRSKKVHIRNNKAYFHLGDGFLSNALFNFPLKKQD